MVLVKLAYGFPDEVNLLDANRQAVAEGAEVFIWNDRLYPINTIQRSIEADETQIAAVVSDLTNGVAH